MKVKINAAVAVLNGKHGAITDNIVLDDDCLIMGGRDCRNRDGRRYDFSEFVIRDIDFSEFVIGSTNSIEFEFVICGIRCSNITSEGSCSNVSTMPILKNFQRVRRLKTISKETER
jgi:hypothetical protein